MDWSGFSFLLVSILANVAVQFFFKVGGTKLGKVELAHLWDYLGKLGTSPEILTGIVCSLLATIASFFVLTRLELRIAGPASALIYIFSVALGHFYFKEQVSLNNLVGLGFIMCGVVLVSSKG